MSIIPRSPGSLITLYSLTLTSRQFQETPNLEEHCYVVGGVTEGERERESDGQTHRPPILWFTPQITTMVRVGPGQSQEPGIPRGSRTWMTGPQVFDPSSTSFPDALDGIWMRSVAARTQTSTHMGGSACDITKPVLLFKLAPIYEEAHVVFIFL